MSCRDAVSRPATIDRRVPLVGRRLVVDERVVRSPVPQRDHEVPLRTLGPRWPWRQLARRNPIGPVGEHLERTLPPVATHSGAHRVAALTGLHAVVPCRDGRVEVVEVLDDACMGVAHLVAELTPLLHPIDPGRLTRQVLGNPVPIRPRAWKATLGRRLDEGVPVVPWVELGSGRRGRRDDAGQPDVFLTG